MTTRDDLSVPEFAAAHLTVTVAMLALLSAGLSLATLLLLAICAALLALLAVPVCAASLLTLPVLISVAIGHAGLLFLLGSPLRGEQQENLRRRYGVPVRDQLNPC